MADTKIRIGNIGGAMSEPAIDKLSWTYLKLKYGTKDAAKRLGVGVDTFRDVLANRKKNLSPLQVARIEKNFRALPRDVKRRAGIASDLFKEATPKQLREYMPEMVKTRKGMANLNKQLDKHAEKEDYNPFEGNRFGSPKAKKVRSTRRSGRRR